MTDALTEQQLDDIQARTTSKHLTPGPWTLDRESCDCGDGYGCSHGMYITSVVTTTPTVIAAERCQRTGEQPRDYDFHRSEIGDFSEADWELMTHAREDIPAMLAEIRRLKTVTTDLAARWEKEAAGTQVAIDTDPLGGEVEAAQHERVHTYRTAASDLREVLATGRIPSDLITPAEAGSPTTP